MNLSSFVSAACGLPRRPSVVGVAITLFAILMELGSAHAATYANPRALLAGDIYDLRRDNWVNQSPSGYEGDVTPKVDEHTGTGGDNRYYRRSNVARAWPSGTGYWYTAADQYAGEPDPAGPQWVDYVPPFEILGPGRYEITASYRWSTSRASYPAVYRVHHGLGTNEVLRDQRIGTSGFVMIAFLLGEFEMRPGSFVRVEDTGAESITFGNMQFKLVTPAPRLQISYTNNACLLRWPTNAVGYRLEATVTPEISTSWSEAPEFALPDGDQLYVYVFPEEPPMFYRLVLP